MGEKEDKEKAEKLAAAKKRVAQLQKKKAAAGDKSTKSKDETPKSPVKESAEADDIGETEAATATIEEDKQVDEDPDEAAFNDVIKAAASNSQNATEESVMVTPPSADADQENEDMGVSVSSKKGRHPGRQASVSIQSKMRSTSFRDTAVPASPSAGPLPRIEELEKENKRLAREAGEYEARWRKVEEEREDTVSKSSEEIEGLKAEIEVLKRQQQQQRQSSVSTSTKASRRESTSASAAAASDLDAKESTIADMQLEISRLRNQTQTSGGDQIIALQASLIAAESKLRALEAEHQDTKKALARASEKALRDGTQATSHATALRAAERDLASAMSDRDEALRKTAQFEAKVDAMNKLHREAEARHAAKLSTAEAASREVPGLKARLERAEAESSRLREKHKRAMSGSGGDEGLDELEDEERKRLERKIRELESQVFELQRGVWRDKRVAMQPGAEGERTSLDQVGADFDEVDLSGQASSRRRSFANALLQQQQQAKHSGFTQVLSSGLAAFRAATTSPDSQARSQTGRQRNDSMLQEFDDDDDGMLDEAAFATAQREEEARKMVAHVREVKRGLKAWEGWRLDLVDARRGGGGVGIGEVFEV